MALYSGKFLPQVMINGSYRNYYFSEGAALNDGVWHSFKFDVKRYSSSGLKIYVDRVLAGAKDPICFIRKSLSDDAPFYIGKHSSCSNSWFSGILLI